MAQLTIEVNGRPYLVGCEDGQEEHLRQLSKLFDAQVRQLTGEVGQLGETRLFLMGALMMADELAEVKSRVAQLQAEAQPLRAARAAWAPRAPPPLATAAKRIETLAMGQGAPANGALI